MPTTKPFKTEADLCAAFIADIPAGWTPYAETAGWDLLLSRDRDGFQIGIEAKLRLNAVVLSQAIESGSPWAAERAGPDCRAVLVPAGDAGDFDKIAGYIGLTVIKVYRDNRPFFRPLLPDHSTHDWFECAPMQRHKLPAYVPDVRAGAAAPLQLTDWKIAAIKIQITLLRRGFVTRADFEAHRIDYRRWIAAGADWLVVDRGRFVAGKRFPDFRSQHPRNYAEIEADAEKWMAP